MDEYSVGSVANLISRNKFSDVKGKRDKYKPAIKKTHNNSKETLIKENEKQIQPNLKSKNKKKCALLNLAKELSPNNDCTSKVKTDKKNHIVKADLKKKKTDLSMNNSEDLPKSKKIKMDLLPLNHVPSDSEEEIYENVKVHSKDHLKPENSSESNDLKENTVFVGNIPITYDKQKIYRIFSKFGEIQNARIRCVPIADINMSKRVAAIKKSFSPKRNSLVAYVKFKSQDSVNSALKANGMVIDGHHLRIDLAEENKERDNNKAVFVGGLPFDIEDDELWEFFEHCGKINSVRIVRDSQTSMGKGFGYVNFDSTASVELALKMNGQELKKRTVNVKRYTKTRNKNKLNSFGKKRSNELTNQLLCKKGKKFKEEKKKLKKERNEFLSSFQGRTASMKQKKKKKLTKAALRQRKLVKILTAS